MISEARDFLNQMKVSGEVDRDNYSRLFDLIVDLETTPGPDQPQPNLLLEHGKTYWVTFIDGSRIKAEAWADKRGDLDLSNDGAMEWSMWAQDASGKPVNREEIQHIEPVGFSRQAAVKIAHEAHDRRQTP